MKNESVTDALLREFLLGKLADKDREELEGLFLTDSATRERVLALEQELVDDYLEGSLSEDERERFVSRYAQTDEQRRKLRITGAIKDWAVREAKESHRAVNRVSTWSRFEAWVGLKPRFLVPIAAAIVIAVVLAIVWLNSRLGQREHLAIEQEVAQLNSPTTLRESPAAMSSFSLRPGSVRSVEPQTEIKIPADVRLVELQLLWTQSERYSKYEAKVKRVGARESLAIRDLQAEDSDGYKIRLRLPPQMLTRGDYRITLTGVANGGSASSSEEYSFTVGN